MDAVQPVSMRETYIYSVLGGGETREAERLSDDFLNRLLEPCGERRLEPAPEPEFVI